MITPIAISNDDNKVVSNGDKIVKLFRLKT